MGAARIGVLALQGGFAAHCRVLRELGHEPVEVRYADQLDLVAGLVLPGGESTTMLKLIEGEGLSERLDAFVRQGRPVLGTCAGLILSACEVLDPPQESFCWLDVTVKRNGFGRQLDSFEARADGSEQPLIFIRAPRITRVGPRVEVLETHGGEPILVRQGPVLGATFHPELTGSRWVHQAAFGAASDAAPSQRQRDSA